MTPHRRLIAAIGELPALPHTYSTLMDALTDPNVSLDQVGAIVESDLAVAAKVLQLVNSAFFGLSREVTTIATAVGYLGFDVLRQLVMAVELFRTFSPDCRVAGFSMEEIQRHSRCVAAIAARLPIAAEKPAPTSVASLLHDIGKLVLATRLPETFERALQASIVQKRPLFLIEEEMTGTTHAQVGGYLLALWGLPASIVAAVSHHHRPVCTSPDQTVDMSMAVHLADMLAHNAASGIDEPLSLGDEIAAALKPWNDDVPTWQSMASDAVEREVRCLERGL